MTRFLEFDENVVPKDCDPKLHSLTFELRSRRHEIEQSISDLKQKLLTPKRMLSIAYNDLNIIHTELNQKQKGLEAFQVRNYTYTQILIYSNDSYSGCSKGIIQSDIFCVIKIIEYCFVIRLARFRPQELFFDTYVM